MSVSSEYVRREARESQREHRRAMTRMREAVRRAFGSDRRVPAAARSELALGGLDRRRFLQVGGLTIASAAVIAACGDDNGDGGSTAATDPMETDPTGNGGNDVTILRTAQSLEELAVNVYQTAIDSGLVTTMAVADAAVLFQEQHQEHAELFAGATEQAGGQAFDEPNPAVLDMIQPAIDALTDENGVVSLAFDLETVATQTYQA
ncbi:MAG: ferritin-like domain-containing protein, partial [Acidimicrobiia bacterium]